MGCPFGTEYVLIVSLLRLPLFAAAYALPSLPCPQPLLRLYLRSLAVASPSIAISLSAAPTQSLSATGAAASESAVASAPQTVLHCAPAPRLTPQRPREVRPHPASARTVTLRSLLAATQAHAVRNCLVRAFAGMTDDTADAVCARAGCVEPREDAHLLTRTQISALAKALRAASALPGDASVRWAPCPAPGHDRRTAAWLG
jgi:DNA topoisomerase VI subunit B